MENTKKKVVIIGAGPAGLTAGYELLRQSDKYEVVIMEESGSMGGISRTVYTQGNRMDIGGHRFFSKNEKVMEWWESFLPLQGKPAADDRILGREAECVPGGPDPDKEDLVFLKRHRISRIFYKNSFFDYPVKLNMQTLKNLGFITAVTAGFSYLKTIFYKRQENSLEDFYINRFGRKLYSIFFEGYTEKLWGRHPSEISPDWGAQRVKGLSIYVLLKDIFQKYFHKKNREVETSLIESFFYPKHGPGQLWEEVAAQFKKQGGKLLTGCKVEEIISDRNRVSEIRYRENGEQKAMAVDQLFSSMPLKDLISGMNEAPLEVKKTAEGLPYRDFVTVGILVKKLKIKNKTDIPTLGDIVPDCWIYVQDKGIKMGRIQIFNNWSPYLVEEPQDTVWMGLEYFCTEGDEMWNMAEAQWTEFARKELVKMKILDEDTEILHSHCEKVQKAYPAYFDTYSDISKLESWIDGIPNLYCIGRNGQHHYNNMDHSMLTSFEAVKLMLSGAEDKSSLWNINTEKMYHEENENK